MSQPSSARWGVRGPCFMYMQPRGTATVVCQYTITTLREFLVWACSAEVKPKAIPWIYSGTPSTSSRTLFDMTAPTRTVTSHVSQRCVSAPRHIAGNIQKIGYRPIQSPEGCFNLVPMGEGKDKPSAQQPSSTTLASPG
ncbi:hypothetical protein P3342_002852 [Pyrenophora teres f. teres]|nr:hypothetical protein P3342_002852 [Pyrenophora teres f. teres]